MAESGRRTGAEALIALAARASLREAVDWAEIDAVIARLAEQPMRAKQIGEAIRRLNDIDLADVLEDWLRRAARDRRREAARAARVEQKIAAPLQQWFSGLGAMGATALAVGTLTPPGGILLVAAFVVGAAAATWGRYRGSKRGDDLVAEAEEIERLSEIVAKEIEARGRARSADSQ